MKGNTPETSVLKVTFLTLYEYCYIEYHSYIKVAFDLNSEVLNFLQF